MKNLIVLKNDNEENIEVEILLNFIVVEYNKNYIAYTINDDNISQSVAVFISEIDIDNKRMISIPDDQANTVLEIYNQLKQEINNY